MKTYVINPDTQKPVSLEEWAKDADPTRAELLLVDTGEKRILMKKNFFPGEHNFEDAQKIAAGYKPFPDSPFSFRCPTRKEAVDLYDARFLGETAIDDRGVLWYMIRWNGKRAWVSSRYTKKVRY